MRNDLDEEYIDDSDELIEGGYTISDVEFEETLKEMGIPSRRCIPDDFYFDEEN